MIVLKGYYGSFTFTANSRLNSRLIIDLKKIAVNISILGCYISSKNMSKNISERSTF